MALRTVTTDPMLRLLLLAIVLAWIVPATGELRTVAGWTANAAVFTLFLFNGMKIARRDVRAGMANWRYLLPLTAFVFGAMPLLGLATASLAQGLVPLNLAIGFLYLGCLTTTVQSATAYSNLAGGNGALSVIGAAVLNLLGLVLTVPVFIALGGQAGGAVGWEAAGKIVLLILLPFALGQAARGRAREWVDGHRHVISWVDRIGIAIAVYVAFSGAVAEGLADRMNGASWTAIVALVALLLLAAHATAWAVSGALGLARPDRISFLFSGAQKSAAMGAPLSTILFARTEAGFIVLPLLLYHLMQLVVAAPLASQLAARHRSDADGCTEPTTGSSGQSGPHR